MGVTVSSDARLDPDELAALEEQHHFLIRSLVDLDRELEAGDLDEDDYDTLRADYRARADAVERAIAEGKARFAAAKRPRSPLKAVAVVAAVATIAIVAGVLVAHASGRRDDAATAAAAEPGGTTRQRLADCFALGSQGSLLDATKCYGDVLKAEPANPEALAYLGWFLYLAGRQADDERLLADGAGFVDRSIAADATYPDARAFKALILRQRGDSAGALAQLEVLDTLHPSALVASLVAPLRTQLEADLASSTTTSVPP